MEANYGILSIIPAVIVIGLALYTKKTVLSLLIGIFIGVTILNGWNPLVAVVSLFREYLYPNLTSTGNIKTIIIIVVLQGFVKMLKLTGAGESIARWARKHISSKRSAEVTTCVAGFAFIYTEPNFVLGAVMRPVTEAFNVARVKLAYITDSLGCNVASLSPVCSYGPYYVGLIAAELAALGITADAWSYYWKYLPNNLYAILAILVAYYVAASGKDIGPMYLAEKRASETGRLLGPEDDPIVKDRYAGGEGAPRGSCCNRQCAGCEKGNYGDGASCDTDIDEQIDCGSTDTGCHEDLSKRVGHHQNKPDLDAIFCALHSDRNNFSGGELFEDHAENSGKEKVDRSCQKDIDSAGYHRCHSDDRQKLNNSLHYMSPICFLLFDSCRGKQRY